MRQPLSEAPAPGVPALLLASQSPRRARLLRGAGYAFTQQSPPFSDPDQPPETVPAGPTGDDASGGGMSPAERYATGLARRKAVSMVQGVETGFRDFRGFRGFRDFRGLVLAADTLCVGMRGGEAGKLVGKPRDRADARAMLRGFVGGEHAVVSGVALVRVGGDGGAIAVSGRDAGALRYTLLADTAVVRFGDVDEDALESYLDTGDWRGKAGGYNLLDRQQAGWPITVTGDPATVVGLPMRKLHAALAGHGLHPAR